MAEVGAEVGVDAGNVGGVIQDAAGCQLENPLQSKADSVQSRVDSVQSQADPVQYKANTVQSKANPVQSKTEYVQSKANSVQYNADSVQSKADFIGARLVGIGKSMQPSHRSIEISSSVWKIGRSLAVDLCLKDVVISKEQAVFTFDQSNSSWTVTDNSSNGIKINKTRIAKGVPAKLNFKDVIMLSDQVDKYRWMFVRAPDKENVVNHSFSAGQEEWDTEVDGSEAQNKKRSAASMSGSSTAAKRVKFTNSPPKISLKLLEREKEEKERLAEQIEEQSRRQAAERELFQQQMSELKAEKERAEEEQRRAIQLMRQKEELTKEELKKREEENSLKQAEINQQIDDERTRASCTEEENLKKQERISELETQMEKARVEAGNILQQEKEEKARIAKDMEAQTARILEDRLKLEQQMVVLQAEKAKEEAEREERQAEMVRQLAEKEAEQKLKDEESRVKLERMETTLNVAKDQGAKEVLDTLEDTLESQTVCSTCLELPIHPVFLNCGHSFCWLCLEQWKHSKNVTNCPICRTEIISETRGISLENFIEAIISQLGPAKVEERRLKVKEREGHEQTFRVMLAAKKKPATVLPVPVIEVPGSRRGGRGGRRGRGIQDIFRPATSSNQRGGSAAANQRGGSTAANQRGGSTAANQRGGSVAANQRGGSVAANQRGRGAANGRGGSASTNLRGGSSSNQRGGATNSPIPRVGIRVIQGQATVITPTRVSLIQAAASRVAEQAAASRVAPNAAEASRVAQPATEPSRAATATTTSSTVYVNDNNDVVYVSSDDDEAASQSSSNSDDSRGSGGSDDSEVEGVEGSNYGGYGRCFRCNRRGHWAPGCPDY